MNFAPWLIGLGVLGIGMFMAQQTTARAAPGPRIYPDPWAPDPLEPEPWGGDPWEGGPPIDPGFYPMPWNDDFYYI